MKTLQTTPILFLASAMLLVGCGDDTSEQQSSEQSDPEQSFDVPEADEEAVMEEHEELPESELSDEDFESYEDSEATAELAENERSKEEEQAQQDTVKSGENLNENVSDYDSPYLDVDFSQFKNNVENDSLIDAIDNSVLNYQDTATQVIDGAKESIQDIRDNIQPQIEQGQEVVEEQQATYDENCEDTSSEEQAEQCSDIEENIFNTEQRIQSLEVDMNNRIGEIENQRNNQLGQLKTQFVNNLNQNRTEEGLEPVDPFDI